MNKKIAQSWQDKQNILLTTHTRADGDAVGSLVVMESYLKRLGKNVDSFIDEGVPKYLRFLLPKDKNESDYARLDDKLERAELIIILDVSEASRAKLSPAQITQPIVIIDHHLTNQEQGPYDLIDQEASSTTEIIFKLLQELEVDITPFEATALLAGLITDTGSFQHDNTDAEAFEIAGQLLALGADQSAIARNIYTWDDNKQFKVRGHVLSKAVFDQKNKAIVTVLTTAEMKSLNITEDDVSGIVSMLQTCREADYAALLIERENGEIKGSLRSDSDKDFDVSKVAEKLGGGGHKYAAGFVVPGRIIKKNGEILIKKD